MDKVLKGTDAEKIRQLKDAAENWEKAGDTRAENAKAEKNDAAAKRGTNKNGEAGDAEDRSADEENKASDNYSKAAKNWDKIAKSSGNQAEIESAEKKAKAARQKAKEAKERAAQAHERAGTDHGNNNDGQKKAASLEKAAVEREELAEGNF
ncbi:hypothetical protein GCM10007094_41380 [Pseudovibrio japonicus]|uniref:Uncharacterized protein n=1 Tax=Pseudovibrio japonicus TaxID=366534 RepID=A0ABQ3ERZ0_9HYPH|nr:hypothetical protein [Pseudovibrio japonicus]GHB47801.1 hypothetical protein GCM10007094_41380 [Pseudovibrio japonicus]